MKEKEVTENINYTICNQLENNMLSHAYFIETGNCLEIEDLLVRIAKSILCSRHGCHNDKEQCDICTLIDSGQCNDFRIIYPQGSMIKKEQLLEIKKSFKTTSQNQYRIYVIYNADRLNVSAANTILKFLEEPEKGIIAFLVAKNRYQVLETLVSRCQVLTVHTRDNMNFDTSMLEFLKMLTTNEKFYLDFKSILDEYMSDKNVAKDLLGSMELYLHQLLLSKIDSSFSLQDSESFTNLSKDSIIKYISILEEEKEKLLYNVNYKLWVNHLLVRFLEVLSC